MKIGTLSALQNVEFNSNQTQHEEEIMKKRTLTTMVGIFSGLALSTALYAGGDFATYDTNQDGSISAEEAAVDSELSKNWSTIDADENGMVDAAEFSAFEGAGSGATEAPAEGQ
jgi:Ca2+-binding EF-hand superfamily protein